MAQNELQQQQAGEEVRVVVLVQNLQKQTHLASDLIIQYQPLILLAQEVNLSSESASFAEEAVAFTSRSGYGTAIYSHTTTARLSNVHRVESPHAEMGGFIRKKTIIATTCIDDDGKNNQTTVVQWISFHGYNGQPFKKSSYLVDHIRAVLDLIDEDNAVFAGDFNTWSQAHLDAITIPLEDAGFRHALSWKYPGREFPLDHVFLKGSVTIQDSTIFPSESDHLGALLVLSVR
jgi:endonuclease/exonuclease/phosphatase (EEP) superfamily protein YafD